MRERSQVRFATIFGILSLIIAGIVCLAFIKTDQERKVLRPYFTYASPDIKALKSLSSNKMITEPEINDWVKIAFTLVRKNHKEIDAARVYAYLFTAQRDAAALSYQVKKKPVGSLTAVSAKTLCLLLPDECAQIPHEEKPDAYSSKIAEMVTQKVDERLREEKKNMKPYPLPSASKKWNPDTRYFDIAFGHQKPWLIDKGDQFRLAPPTPYETEAIKLQREDLENILKTVTKEQLAAVHKWDAGAGAISTSSQWLELAHQYMEKRKIPLNRAILIRSILAMGLADASIAAADSKYTHWKQRPHMMFPDLPENLKTPNSPGYPSGHATLAMAAAIIMDAYFPENEVEWDKTAQEMADSRLWAGVHFPIDHHDGLNLGHKIGQWIIKKVKEYKQDAE
jgi:hypothetical protein